MFIEYRIRIIEQLLLTILFCFNQGCGEPGWTSQANGVSEHLCRVSFEDIWTGTMVGGMYNGTTLNHFIGKKALVIIQFSDNQQDQIAQLVGISLFINPCFIQ